MDLIEDDQAERLAKVAVALAGRVRDFPADENAEWLVKQLPDPADWWRLTFVLAAAVPDDRSWKHLTAWTIAPLGPQPASGPTAPAPALKPVVKPCEYRGSTDAGARKHRTQGEAVCRPCGEAERVYNRRRSAANREQAAA